MQQQHLVSSRLVLAVAGTLVLGACAAETTASDTPASTATPVTTTAPPTATIPPTTVGPTVTVAPTTDPPPATAPPAELPEATPGPCGAYGPLPALPDSMPTVLFDTDGDGEADDEVTAYGAADGWRVRVTEDGVTSEAPALGVAAWGYLDAPIPTGDGDQIAVADNDDPGSIWYFATGDDGCVRPLLDPPHEDGIDDLAAPQDEPTPTLPPTPVDEIATPQPDPIPPVTPVDDLAAFEDELLCGPLPDIPVNAVIGSDLWLDLDGHGAPDDRLVSYAVDGNWFLRGWIGPSESEVAVPGAGVHGVSVLGTADVDHTYGGDEIVAVVGGGAYSVEIGFFAFLEGGCLHRYLAEGGGEFGPSVGASIAFGSGLACVDGRVVETGFQRMEDDTYTVWEASYEPVSVITFGGAADVEGFEADGLTADEAAEYATFDCHGLTL